MIIEPKYNVGIDTEILRIQRILDELDYSDLHIYGRIQPTQKGKETANNNMTIAEVYTEKGEYRDVFIDDTKGGVIGFEVIDRVYNLRWQSTVDIIFTINLDLAGIKGERYDEVFLTDAVSILQANGINIKGVKEGVEDVFSSFETGGYTHRDMQPNFVFSIEIDLFYSTNIECNIN